MKIPKLKSWLKWLIITVLGIILLVFSLLCVLHLPFAEKILSKEVTKFVSSKTDSEFRIGRIYLNFFFDLELQDIYAEDNSHDTLLKVDQLIVDINLLALLSKKIHIDEIILNNAVGNINRGIDSQFNFQFLIDAFADTTAIDTVATDSAAAPFEFGISEVTVNNIRFSMKDEISGLLLDHDIKKFYIDINDMDLESMEFEIDDLEIADAKNEVLIYKKTAPTEESEPSPFKITLNDAIIENVSVSFYDSTSSMELKTTIPNFEIEDIAFDLLAQSVAVEYVKLANLDLLYNGGVTAVDSTLVTADTTPAKSWSIIAEEIDITNNKIELIGILEDDLTAQIIALQANDLEYKDQFARGEIEKFQMNNNLYPDIRQLSIVFEVDSTSAKVKNLDILAANSEIHADASAKHPNLWKMNEETMNQLALSLNLDKSHINTNDVVKFVPSLDTVEQFQSFKNRNINIAANIQGTLENLNVNRLNILMDSNKINFTGKLKNVTDIEQAYFNINLDTLLIQKSLYAGFIDSATKESFALPPSISSGGAFKGTMKEMKIYNRLHIFSGHLATDITAKNLNNPGILSANGTINVKEFQLGKLLKQDSMLRNITAQADFAVTMKDTQLSSATVDLQAKEFFLNGYNYHNIELAGKLANDSVKFTSTIDDDNLVLDLTANANLDTINPYYSAKLDLKKSNLQELNWSNEQLSVNGILEARFKGKDLSRINGDLAVREVDVIKNGKPYKIDSLIAVSIDGDENTEVSIQSDFISGTLKGNINILNIPASLTQHIDHYIDIAEEPEKKIANEQFTFELKIEKPEILTQLLVPGLDELVTGKIEGSYNSKDTSLKIEISLPYIDYQDMQIDSFYVDINSNDNALKYDVGFSSFKQGALDINATSVAGDIKNDKIDTRLTVRDESAVEKYQINTLLAKKQDQYELSIQDQGLIISYDTWNVNEGNKVVFGDSTLQLYELQLSHGQEKLTISSPDAGKQVPPLKLEFDNFRVSTIGNAIQPEKDMLEGNINGFFTLKKQNENLVFMSDMTIEQFKYGTNYLGDISFKARQVNETRYEVEATVKGANDIELKGYYLANEKGDYKMNIDLDDIALKSLDSIAGDQITQLKGNITGNMILTGDKNTFDINGSLNFNQASVRIALLGTPLYMNNETITFNKRGFVLNKFTIEGQGDDKMVIDGFVDPQTYVDYDFNLSINTDHFHLMNTTAENSDLFYGDLYLKSDMKLTGNTTHPHLKVDATLDDSTDVTYILPITSPSVTNSEGVIEFVEVDSTAGQIKITSLDTADAGDTVKAGFEGITVDARVRVASNTIFKLIVDPYAGDYLQIQGGGDLKVDINESGDITMVGQYEVQDGEYRLSFYGLVKKKFLLAKGSTIYWQGDPTDATMDIRAEYEISTDPKELFVNSSNYSAQLPDAYSKRLPFIVGLNIEGELLKPEITFDISLEEKAKGALNGAVNAKLDELKSNEAELNKQVFALLVLNGFVASTPTDGGGGSAVNNAARSSVSKILTNQLNNLSNRYIKGAELDFNLQSYETASGGNVQSQTDLEVGLTKNLLNDRLSVRVGGNVNLEGGDQTAQQQQGLSNIAGDIIIEYKITEDGRYKFKVFRANKFEGVLDGEIIETGVGIVFTRDYNTFNELFSKDKKEDEEY